MNQQSIQQAQQSQSSIHTPPLIYRIKQYQASTFLSSFSYALIRPPRFMYNEQLLYPPEHYQLRYQIEHHEIPFKLTLYKTHNMQYVILYLHGNSSSRFEGYMQLRDLPDGVGLACFDFNGCGMRFEAEFITLGAKECKDVDVAVRFLRGLGLRVVGWGRSMGAVSLLLSDEVDVMVADSPFYSLQHLCKQSSYSVTPAICCCFFHCLYPCLFSCVRSDVQEKAGFDVRDLQVAKIVANNPRNKQRSLLIMAGTEDSMIRFHHSQNIFNAFPGTKQLQLFVGSHNSNRPQQILQKCYKFIDKQLGIQRKSQKKQPIGIKLKAINKLQNTSNSQKESLESQKVHTKQTSLREETQSEQLSRTNTKEKLLAKKEEIEKQKDKEEQKQKEKEKTGNVNDKQKSKNWKNSQVCAENVQQNYNGNNLNTITTINGNSSARINQEKEQSKISKQMQGKSQVEVQSMEIVVQKVNVQDYKTKQTQPPKYIIKGKKDNDKKPYNDKNSRQTSFELAKKQESKIEERQNSQIQLVKRSSSKKQQTSNIQQQQIASDSSQKGQTSNTLIDK